MTESRTPLGTDRELQRVGRTSGHRRWKTPLSLAKAFALLALALPTSCGFIPSEERYYTLTAEVGELQFGDIGNAGMDNSGTLYITERESRFLFTWSESTGAQQYFDFDEKIVSLGVDYTGAKVYVREGINLWEIDTKSDTKYLVYDTILGMSRGIGIAGDYLVVASVDDSSWPEWEELILIRRVDFVETDRLYKETLTEEYGYLDEDQMLLLLGMDGWLGQESIILFEIDQETGTFGTEFHHSRWTPPFGTSDYLRVSEEQKRLIMKDGYIIGINSGNIRYEGKIRFENGEGRKISDACFVGNALIVISNVDDRTELTVHASTTGLNQTEPGMHFAGVARRLFTSGKALYLLAVATSANTMQIYKFDTSIYE
jgi:hypothetical protein